MKSKPNFEVDIVKPDGKTLSFSCSYIAEHDEQGTQEEGFGNRFCFLRNLKFGLTFLTWFYIKCDRNSFNDAK